MSTILTARDGGWLTVWFNRPEARNALSSEMVAALQEVLDGVAQDRSVRGITLRGKGGIFCAGGDLKGFSALGDVEAASKVAGVLFERINTMPQVVVALVEGAAMAGGLGIVCACDVVAVTGNAKFALTEVTLGIPPAQIAPFVVGRLGMATARRLMLTAARFDGVGAKANGLADVVCDDVDGLEAFEADVRAAVYRGGPEAIAVTKDIVLATGRVQGAELRDYAARGFAACLTGDEGREGIAAFVEKRKPEWAL
jgi:isohexenylglutaconyl-CoA hydratase